MPDRRVYGVNGVNGVVNAGEQEERPDCGRTAGIRGGVYGGISRGYMGV